MFKNKELAKIDLITKIILLSGISKFIDVPSN